MKQAFSYLRTPTYELMARSSFRITGREFRLRHRDELMIIAPSLQDAEVLKQKFPKGYKRSNRIYATRRSPTSNAPLPGG